MDQKASKTKPEKSASPQRARSRAEGRALTPSPAAAQGASALLDQPAPEWTPEGVLDMQRAAGNRAVSRALSQPRTPPAPPEGAGGPLQAQAQGQAPVPLISPVVGGAPGGWVFRDGSGGADTQAKPKKAHHPDGSAALGGNYYYIYGTWRDGDSQQAWVERTINTWIVWRYGRSATASAKKRVQYFILGHISYTGVQAEVGKEYYIRADLNAIEQISRMMGKMPQAEAAEKREKEAGLPTAEEAQATQIAEQKEGEAGAEDQGQGGQDPGAEMHPPSAQEGPRQTGEPSEGTSPEGGEYMPSGSEYEGGTGEQATAPAFPAELLGPTQLPEGALGTYRMRLDYSIAGPDQISQVAAAMIHVYYHWERFDITAMARSGLKEQAQKEMKRKARSEDDEVGAMAGAGRRFEEDTEELKEDTVSSAKGLINPGGETPGEAITRIYANEANLALLPASAIVSYGGTALGALADFFGGDFHERDVPLPKREGVFLIRCIASPVPGKKIKHAPSVATRIVEVFNLNRLSRDALELPMAAADEKRAELAMARKEDPPDPQKLARLEKELQNLETAAAGPAVDALSIALENKILDRNAATGLERERLDKEVKQLEELQARAEKRANRMEAGSVFRVQGAIVSRLTGQTYQLILQAGRLPSSEGRFRYRISDVTSRDGEEYDRSGSTPSDAFWAAAAWMAEKNDYGRGSLSLRVPDDAGITPTEKTLPNRPGPEKIAKQRLADLTLVLTAVSLVIPGAGEVAMALGAALAADRLISRWQNDALRLDSAAIGDFLAILGAAAGGAAIIGKLRVVRAGENFMLAAEDADLAALSKALQTAQKIERGTELANQVVGWGGYAWGSLDTLNTLLEINQAELSGAMTHGEARRKRAQLLAKAINDGTLQFAGAVKGHTESEGAAAGHEPGAPEPKPPVHEPPTQEPKPPIQEPKPPAPARQEPPPPVHEPPVREPTPPTQEPKPQEPAAQEPPKQEPKPQEPTAQEPKPPETPPREPAGEVKPGEPAGGEKPAAGEPEPGQGGQAPEKPLTQEEIEKLPGKQTLDGQDVVKVDPQKKIRVCSWPCQYLEDRYHRELYGDPGPPVVNGDPGLVAQLRHLETLPIADELAGAILLQEILQERRRLYLGTDLQNPATPVYRIAEGWAGQHLERSLGRPVERLNTGRREHAGLAGDWVDPTTRRTYDAVGPMPPGAAHHLNVADFNAQIDAHLRKGVDFIYVDLAFLTTAQVESIWAHIAALPADQQRRIIVNVDP